MIVVTPRVPGTALVALPGTGPSDNQFPAIVASLIDSRKGRMSTFLEQLFNGLIIASVLLLIALGLTFTFGQMGVINMAQGELIMAGAFTPYVLQTQVAWFAGAAGTAFLVALPLAFVVGGLLGFLMNLILRRMYGRALDTLLVTFGIALLLQQVAKDIFGAPNVEVVVPSWLQGNWRDPRVHDAAHAAVHHLPRDRGRARGLGVHEPARTGTAHARGDAEP